MERIEKLRLVALDHYPRKDEFFYHFFKKYSADERECEWEKYADAYYCAFENYTPHIGDGELIVGECELLMSEDDDNEWENVYHKIADERGWRAGGGQDSHMAIDYELLLKVGLSGIIKKTEKYLESCDEEKKPFYNTCKKCLEAVILHSKNYAKKALSLAEEEKDEKRKAELLEISRICNKVPEYPAESFHEAVQAVHFISYCLSINPYRLGPQQFQLGRPDRYLLPYYLEDMKKGALTKERAQLLLDLLGIQINMRVPNGLSSGYMVGGKDENGNIVANDLTEMCMQVIDDIRLVYPSVGLCYTQGLDDKYLEKACEILSHGRSHPAIFGDETIVKGLRSYGVPEDRACSYIHSTCVEITPVAASNVWVASPYTNMPQLLLDIMDKEYESFDDLKKALFDHLDARIKRNFENESHMRSVRAENSMNPLLSCFVDDCLARGLDIERGGAVYNWIMPSFVGVANLVDSLYAVKAVVFDKKLYSMADFKKIVDSDFENEGALRSMIENTLPKYGNDNDEIDSYFSMITEHLVSECKKYKSIHSNANLIPSVFCWIMHEWFGRETGATPDGRRAGFPLGDGSGPCQGREMNGPTASILSSTKWEHHELIGGVAVNMKFSKKSLGENSLDVMKNIVKTYVSRGGFEIQINVIDKETLEKAVKNPEQYKDLVVRIGGYSDYFTRISPQMQKEVILRTEHEI